MSGRKRMKRSGRQQAARGWLATYNGKNVVKGYAKRFGVDLGCALKELQLLGVEIDATYLAALRMTLENRARRPANAASTCASIPEGYGSDWDDDFADIAGFTSGGAPFGVTWDDLEDTGD